MSPSLALPIESCDRRLQKVKDAANETIKQLRERNPISKTLQRDLDDLVATAFPLSRLTSVPELASELDTLGCDLWNAATNFLRESQNDESDGIEVDVSAHTSLAVQIRTFAFFILDSAYHSASRRLKHDDQERESQSIRHFKVGLKTCRSCLDNDKPELALKVFERISVHVSAPAVTETSPLVSMSHVEDEVEIVDSPLAPLQTEFYLLRIMHGWKSDRLDLAEHFYGKVKRRDVLASPSLAEKAAQLYYELGRALLKSKSAPSAIIWLKRAMTTLDNADLAQLGPDAGDLRLSISGTLVEAFVSDGSHASLAEAQAVVTKLEPVFGHRMAVQMMRFNVLSAQQPANANELRDVLHQMAQSVTLTEHMFKILMQKIHHLHRQSTQAACLVLERLIIARLLPHFAASQAGRDSVQEWIETACITYTLFATGDGEFVKHSALASVVKILDALVDHGIAPTTRAVHAAQTLIWKVTGASSDKTAQEWCEILRHRVFEAAGQSNKSKIGRKAMLLAMARDDQAAARAAFFAMSPAAQNEARSRYLAFKLALQSRDYDLARDCLSSICKCPDRDAQFLYACVLEAQQSPMRAIAIAALQTLLDKRPPGTNLPSLLRCTARLLAVEIEAPGNDKSDVATHLVRVFETAAASISIIKQAREDQWPKEMKWWGKNAYNLALRLCADVEPEILIRFLRVCLAFLENYDVDEGKEWEVDDRRRLCRFLCVSALIVLARSSEEGSEQALNAYLQARKEIAAYKAIPTLESNTHVSTTSSNIWQDRLFELHKFDLESILQLKQWDELDGALQSCLELHDTDRWDTLADLLLIIHERTRHIFDAPASTSPNPTSAEKIRTHILRLLDRIVNDTWKRQKDLSRAAKWLRLSFSIAITSTPLLPPSPLPSQLTPHSGATSNFALTLLSQATAMASKHVHRASPFPETELQWLATTAFNRAIDILGVKRDETAFGEAEKWMLASLDLARFTADQGALHANLTGRRERVRERVGLVGN